MKKENAYLQWLSKETQSVYWHDSAIMEELNTAEKNGARGLTTNPFLVASTLQQQPAFWQKTLPCLPQAMSLDGDEKAEAIMQCVVNYLAAHMAPYRSEGKWKGYCCIQTNPTKPCDSAYMIEQAKRYMSYSKNLVVKLPATRMGIEAIEECAALGMNVAATVSFTVPQVLAVAEAIKRGFARARVNGLSPGIGIAVIMVGRLDDYLRDVAQDSCSPVTESDIRMAGIAVFKRAYEIFLNQNYECVLMPAGCRGGYHIAELAGARAIMSIAPRIADDLALLEKPFKEGIQIPVDSAIINRLATIPEFIKAYEPEGMCLDHFITFGSSNRTLDQFINCGWNPMKSLILC